MVGKMKDKTAGVAIKERVGLKPKMYSYLADDNSEHKKAKSLCCCDNRDCKMD